ncbi:hypothetical protein V6N13_077916 [Hibiscus sabdariffa]|uniref:Uncharacterized protein n=1 Tax=Hibiscus sabdariffa TaxID=183260 RepID=A0ABR2RMG7_9ROSI
MVENHPYSLSGFSKLSLPPLHRPVSDPLVPAKEAFPFSKGSASSSLHPVSDPIFSPAQLLSTTSTPESPSAKWMRLNRMREVMRNLRLHWTNTIKEVEGVMAGAANEVVPNEATEATEDTEAIKDVEAANEVVPNEATEATEDKGQLEFEETVGVQKIGECLDLHFPCPCGKGYQILLSGENCYYKLT